MKIIKHPLRYNTQKTKDKQPETPRDLQKIQQPLIAVDLPMNGFDAGLDLLNR